VRQILAFAHGATGEQRLLQVKHLLRDITSVIGARSPRRSARGLHPVDLADQGQRDADPPDPAQLS